MGAAAKGIRGSTRLHEQRRGFTPQLELGGMSYGADLVKSMVESLRNELTEVSQAQKDVLNLDDQMSAAQKVEKISEIRSSVCR
jgi:hypothetical protein